MYVHSHRQTSLLEEYGFEHFWVNHTQTFVDPLNPSNHTYNIERVWRSLKSFISHIKRAVPAEILDGYIDTFMLKYNAGEEIFADVVFSILSFYANT